MVIMMVGVILIELNFALGFQKYIILGYLVKNCCKEPPHTWEDVIHLPEFPDGDHDGWGHLHSTGFCLGFPEIYNICCVK